MGKKLAETDRQTVCENGRVALDGVCYARFAQGERYWRLGTVDPGWEQKLPLTSEPDAGRLEQLAGQGLWLAREQASAPRLALMCCGQGSVWPGMGRDLYDSFPEAREAMDRIAACANWDVLALMDEPDVETIGLTRWQQPYLFLLEYAQWSLLRARGLEPDFICGHSLGELIALCLAGVYSPEVCWYIMETRSRHMADLEAKSRRETGMMAVYTDLAGVHELQEHWPELYVSNYNTPGQFILSGPRDTLTEARRFLRRKKIPAVILNITLAFHHPSMRVLRELDYQGLMALEMQAARTPMLSCVTTGTYPDNQADICRYIMDLDENSVRWVECVHALWQRDGIRHFLEVGPLDTLCGLVGSIEPAAVCLASSSRGHERDCMRRTLARLYALGHLPHHRLVTVALERPDQVEAPGASADTAGHGPGPARPAAPGIPELRELLARASGHPVESLHGDMDLRFDLALRSSYFPALIEEAQKALGVEIAFEQLLHVSTIADLERVFRPGAECGEERRHAPLGAPVRRPTLVRCLPTGEQAQDRGDDLPRETPCNPCLRALSLSGDSVVAVAGRRDNLLSSLVRGIAALAGRVRLVDDLPETAACAAEMGAECGRVASPAALAGHPCDVLIWEGALALPAEEVAAICRGIGSPRLVFVEQGPQDAALEGLAGLLALAGRHGLPAVAILVDEDWQDWRDPAAGDLLVRELLCQTTAQGPVLWQRSDRARLLEQPVLDDADRSPFVFPARHPDHSRQTPVTSWRSQFSPEIFPCLADFPCVHGNWHRLPLSLLLEAQLQAAMLAAPGLVPVGLADIRLHAPGAVRQGLVREARMSADLSPWLRLHGQMSRVCRMRTDMADMRDGERESFRSSLLLESRVFLAGRCPDIPRLWSRRPEGWGQKFDVLEWYEQMGIGPSFRLLLSLVQDGDGELLVARLDEQAFLALKGVWGYTDKLRSAQVADSPGNDSRRMHVLEALLQAVAMARLLDPPQVYCEQTPSFIGAVRFADASLDGPLTLALRRCWDRDHVVRYDAQAVNSAGRCVLTITHLEYNAL